MVLLTGVLFIEIDGLCRDLVIWDRVEHLFGTLSFMFLDFPFKLIGIMSPLLLGISGSGEDSVVEGI